MAYLFSNLNLVKNGMKLLNDKEKRAQKLLNLDFVLNLDASGQGVTQAEFILAVLEHEGIISKEKNIIPWAEVRFKCSFFFSYFGSNVSDCSLFRLFRAEISCAGPDANRAPAPEG